VFEKRKNITIKIANAFIALTNSIPAFKKMDDKNVKRSVHD